ncbi:ComEC/Rec2 family competence protein [Nocardia abscessus]|uniref:ComEC/Rec2 family competence protein n=1 Tax=Nocardia abscessus TaxID=120957 RepID=UPI001894D677|nr:ComEC/Rec2 family competence protein [Nocardia abscessus]MBF6338396.1 ComEC/Rec2 family competence protein [Nocardia abscessus]
MTTGGLVDSVRRTLSSSVSGGGTVRGPKEGGAEPSRSPREGVAAEEPGLAQVLDARLLPAALCCWGATILALTAGWRAGLLLAALSMISAIGLWVLLLCAIAHRRERRRAVAVVALAAVVLGAGFAAAAAWREHRVATHPLRAVTGQSLRVVVTPTDDPKPVRARAFGAERLWVVRADLREYRRGGVTVRAGGAVVVLATGPEWGDLSPGRPVEFRARVDQPRRSDLTVVTLHAQGAPGVAGALPWWQRVANSVRADFAASAARALPPGSAGLLPALVVGDTSALSDEVRDDFEVAGLQHLTVVSGANFTILLSVVLFLVRLLTLGPRAAAAVAAAALLMFVVVARPDPSVLRAGAMGAITLLAVLTGRRKQALPALCAAIIALLALWPGLAVDAGFALSVVATGGLILLAPSWADWLRARGWWRMPAEIVAVSAGAFVVTTPIVIALTGRLSLVAVLANVLVAPVIAPITVIGASGAVLACLWSPLADLVLRCAAPLLWWLLWVAGYAAAVPGASVAVPGGLAGGLVAGLLVVIAIAALRIRAVRRIAAAVALGVAAVLVPVRLWHPGWPPDGWVLAACDVGQGDGLALAVGPGAAVVIDVGPDPRPMRTCLDRLRISRVPLLILTHPHADHIGGLTGALHGRAVDAIAVGIHELDGLAGPEQARPSPAAGGGCGSVPAADGHGHADAGKGHALIARADPLIDSAGLPGVSANSRIRLVRPPGRVRTSCGAAEQESGQAAGSFDDPRVPVSGMAQIVAVAKRARVPLLELSAGHVLSFGSVELEVLAPSRNGPRPVRGAETEDANDRSIVVTARTPAGRILLTGDIEADGQRALMRAGILIQADVLKLPHHGSRTTTSEFLDAVRPRLVLVSVGVGNTFGHPHPAVLADLSALGATVARTDRRGDIAVVGGGAHLRVTGSR